MKICYFEFRYLEFSRKIMVFSLRTQWNIFRKFDDSLWKIHENKERISMNFICITFAQYCMYFYTLLPQQFLAFLQNTTISW